MIDILDLTGEYRDLAVNMMPEALFEDEGLNLLAAIEENVLVGVLGFSVTTGVLEIRWIFVDTDMRRRGIGSILLRELIERLDASGSGYIIQAVYPLDEEHSMLHALLSSLEEFTDVETNSVYCITKEMRRDAPRYNQMKELPAKCRRLSSITPIKKRRFYMYLREHGLDLVDMEDENDYVDEMTLVSLGAGGEITAGIFIKNPLPGELVIEYLVSRPGYAREVSNVVAGSIAALEKHYPEDTLIINVLNKDSEKLVKKLFSKDIKASSIHTAVAF